VAGADRDAAASPVGQVYNLPGNAQVAGADSAPAAAPEDAPCLATLRRSVADREVAGAAVPAADKASTAVAAPAAVVAPTAHQADLQVDPPSASALAKITQLLAQTQEACLQLSIGATAPGAATTSAPNSHLEIMQAFVAVQSTATSAPRLGLAGQQLNRQLEQLVRCRVLDCVQRAVAVGFTQSEAAQRLKISTRTLRDWKGDLHAAGLTPLVRPLGRPLAESTPDQQQAVITCLHNCGPGLGLPTLRSRFDGLARAELEYLLKFYRRLWRTEHSRLLHVLHWQQPGTVWAMDFAEAPVDVDGVYPYLLAVRDLASGQQLLWEPMLAPTAELTIEALTMLFTIHGAPLVLKSDNGSAFIAEATRRFLAAWGVQQLFSPPRTPSYNGSIEAAIGSLKTRTQQQADLAGHPKVWTALNVETARLEANTTAQPRRLKGATPEETWATRAPLTIEQRQRFQKTVTRFQAEARAEANLPPTGELTRTQQAAVDRVALRRALVEHDLLLFRRRRVPAQIVRPKAAIRG
jgi:transposase InsO family protein